MTANMLEFLSRSKTVEEMVLRLNSKDTNVPRSRFPECGSSKCSGVLAVEEIKDFFLQHLSEYV